MKIIQNYNVATEQEIKEFISKSTPEQNEYFKFVQGREDFGWVNFYFDNRGELFRVTHSCALNDLTKIVKFFKSCIDLKEEIAIFFEDENISEPMIYVSPVHDEYIRFLIADGKEIYKKWENGLADDEELLILNYEIRCDVIVNKKRLLKEFAESIKNIIRMNSESETKDDYDIGYDKWNEDFEEILEFVK